MPRLPSVSGRQLVAALETRGYVQRRQRGSHVMLRHPQSGRSVSVPVHGNETLPVGTLSGILRDAGLTGDELRTLLC